MTGRRPTSLELLNYERYRKDRRALAGYEMTGRRNTSPVKLDYERYKKDKSKLALLLLLLLFLNILMPKDFFLAVFLHSLNSIEFQRFF